MQKTAILLFFLVSFACIHDGVFALVSLTGDRNLIAAVAQCDCDGETEDESGACQCPAHILEKLDNVACATFDFDLSATTHVPMSNGFPLSYILSPTDPPPKV